MAHGEAILELDELREDVHRELMRCHMACGQRAGAAPVRALPQRAAA